VQKQNYGFLMVFIYCDINSAIKFYQYARHYQENNELSYKTCYLCAVFDKNPMLCVISFKNCTNSAVWGFIYHVYWTMSLYSHRNAQKLPLLLLFSQLCSFFCSAHMLWTTHAFSSFLLVVHQHHVCLMQLVKRIVIM